MFRANRIKTAQNIANLVSIISVTASHTHDLDNFDQISNRAKQIFGCSISGRLYKTSRKRNLFLQLQIPNARLYKTPRRRNLFSQLQVPNVRLYKTPRKRKLFMYLARPNQRLYKRPSKRNFSCKKLSLTDGFIRRRHGREFLVQNSS